LPSGGTRVGFARWDDGESGDSSGSSWEGPAEGEGVFGSATGACGACCFGIFMLPIALLVLGWNENNYVCERKRIITAQEKATSIGCATSGSIQDGELYFFSCPFVQSTLQTFTPSDFLDASVAATEPAVTTISASMTSEMYLCSETCTTKTRKQNGRNVKYKTCDYSLKWQSSYEDGTGFKSNDRASQACGQGYQRNPPAPTNMQLGTVYKYSQSQPVRVGDATGGYILNNDLVTRLTPDEIVDLGNSSISSHYTGPKASTAISSAFTYSRDQLGVSGRYLKSCTTDVLGCIRITFMKSSATSPSVIAQIDEGGQTTPYFVDASWGCEGAPWQAIEAGSMTKAEMITALHGKNDTQVWIIRFVGLLCCWLAVYLCFSPIVAAAECVGGIINLVPCGGYVQDALEGVATAIVCAISCPLGCSYGLFVIALVWLFMRPLYGAILLAVCACCCGGAFAIRSAYVKPEKPEKYYNRESWHYPGAQPQQALQPWPTTT
jgi:hypothetical protein